MIPATAGRVLSEEELRGFVHCAAYFWFGGKWKPNYQTQITQYAFEKMIAVWLRKDIDNPIDLISKFIAEKTAKIHVQEHMLPQKSKDYQRWATLASHEILNIFDVSNYLPIYGPVRYRVRLSKTPVELSLSGVLRSYKNQTLHVLDFSPYHDPHAIKNDVVLHLKLSLLQQLVKPNATRKEDVRIHSFSVTKSGKVYYNPLSSSDIDQTQINHAGQLAQVMELGFKHPSLPCNFNCPYRSRCQP